MTFKVSVNCKSIETVYLVSAMLRIKSYCSSVRRSKCPVIFMCLHLNFRILNSGRFTVENAIRNDTVTTLNITLQSILSSRQPSILTLLLD